MKCFIEIRWGIAYQFSKKKKKKKKRNGQKLIRGYSVTSHLCYRITFSIYFPYILIYCILYVNHIIYYRTIVTVNTFLISQCKSQDSPWEKSHMMISSSSSSAHFGKYSHFWFQSPSLSPCHFSHLATSFTLPLTMLMFL